MKKFLKFLPVAAVTLAMTIFTACGNDDDETTPAAEAGGRDNVIGEVDSLADLEEFIALQQSLAVSLDPPVSNDSASAEFARLKYSTLFVLDYNTLEPIGALAESWNTIDSQNLEVTIRQGVTFHNGDPLTTADVGFSLVRAAGFPDAAPILGMISGYEIIDDYTIIIQTAMPFAPIVNHLSHPASGILPREHVLAVGDDAFAENPIGSGAFMFDNFEHGNQLTLVRNTNYWGTVPAFERFTFREVPEASTRLIEVQTGTAHAAMGIAPVDVAGALADPNVNMVIFEGMGADFIWMNTQQPYLNNPLVRQAINYALDTASMVEDVWLGLGNPHHNPVPPNVFGYATQPAFDVNLDRARELLAEAGYPDGFDTTIWWNSPNAQRQQVSEMVQFDLARIGINVSIETMDWPAYLAGADAGEHDMMIIGWTAVTGDADYVMFPLFHSSSYGSAGNRAFWSTPELDALIEAGRAETNPAERQRIYAEAQAIIRAEAPLILLRHPEQLVAINPNVENFVPNPAMAHNWARVTLR